MENLLVFVSVVERTRYLNSFLMLNANENLVTGVVYFNYSKKKAVANDEPAYFITQIKI